MEDNTFTVKVSPGTKVVVEEVHPGVFDKGGDQVIMNQGQEPSFGEKVGQKASQTKANLSEAWQQSKVDVNSKLFQAKETAAGWVEKVAEKVKSSASDAKHEAQFEQFKQQAQQPGANIPGQNYPNYPQ